MVDVDRAVIARLQKFGSTFEILVDPDVAREYKEGKKVDFDKLLAAQDVFKDAHSGDRCGEESLLKVFETTDTFEVAKKILDKGQIQLTTEQKRHMAEEKFKQVAALISRNAINPQTGTPHPVVRIERAMEEAKVHCDIFKDAEQQMADVVKVLRPLLPLKFEKRIIALKIPPSYASHAQREVRTFGEMKQDQWLKDGSWVAVVEIPAGMQDEFFGKLAGITHGEAETRVLEHFP